MTFFFFYYPVVIIFAITDKFSMQGSQYRFPSTVGHHYNAVWYIMISYTALQPQQQNVNQGPNSI